MKNCRNLIQRIPCLILILLFCSFAAVAQKGNTVKGTVVDDRNEPIVGATVTLKGNNAVGASTDIDGKFTLNVPVAKGTLVVSFIGMTTQEVNVQGSTTIKVALKSSNVDLDEVVVVGYGQQKKASVVGAITQTTGKVLERAAGINDVGSALTGNLPGVITSTSTGAPGAEDPKIVIRGSSSWNNSEPLVLVDGIERPMNSVDITSVQSVSVLKDASATAVYGVKGANGVILITTKRGQDGSAKIEVGFNATMKTASKLPNKYDSYDALMARNVAVEHELAVTPDAWEYIRPQSFIDNYRNQTTVEQRERYANVDWQKALFKDYTMSYNANVNISGGTKSVKYFAAADYVNEGDLFRIYDNGRNYNSGYGYNRLNVRSNLDFNITKTTVLRVNLSGSNGVRKAPWENSGGDDWQISQQWAGAYNIAPDVFLPQYSDGAWGNYPLVSNVTNSASKLCLGGYSSTTTTRINTDFSLEQDLSFITPGLRAQGTVSWDNSFVESGRGINDQFNGAQYRYIDPVTGIAKNANEYDTNNGFDWQQGVNWSTSAGQVNDWATARNLYYQAQLNWVRSFGKHNLTAMGAFNRRESASGSEIPRYREDWVFRATYNWAGRYMLEYNGAYNGSERFSKENRFAFFNSGAIGWTISEEPFFESIKEYVNYLKFRASYGEIGDDNVGGRWLYMNQWSYGGNTPMDVNHANSVYSYYRQSALGNEDVKWETVAKTNLGIEYTFLNGLLSGTLDFFRDERTDILVNGADRAIPSYFGATPATANLGKSRTTGYELELRINKSFANSLRLWGNFSMTHARNKILRKDDLPMEPNYQKDAGYSIGQTRSYIDDGYIQTFDQLYGTPAFEANDNYKLPGDYYIVDFNGDGVIDQKDITPCGYTSTPENTYNVTVGAEWRGFSCFAQIYGVSNVTREVNLTSFGSKLNTVYDAGSWWSVSNPNADVTVPRFNSTTNSGTQYLYDGSFVRLKNVELAYTFTKGFIKKAGIENMKIYVSGNNLWLWTKMPDDRETNSSGYGGSVGAYPTLRRFNLGVKLTF